jgi:hypothetical protein
MLSFLEGVILLAHERPPEDCQVELYYVHQEPPSRGMLPRCAERDMKQLRAMWKP